MSQNTVINETQGNFTVVLNKIINYKGKSMKCLGLYFYLASKSDNWKFNINEIITDCKEGKTAIRATIKELEKNGWLIREKDQNNKKTWKLKK